MRIDYSIITKLKRNTKLWICYTILMDLREEKKLWRKGFKRVAGLDEAGRGPLAGPVTATAVTIWQIPNSKFQIANKLKKIRDSKKLSPKRREEFYKILIECPAIEWGIGRVGPKVIDRVNILEATKLAMKRAVENLERKNKTKIDFLVLDGNFKIDHEISQRPIIKADQKIFSCQAASIISKVTRDRAMKRYHKKYPQYGFDKHKGYPTKFHLKMLKKYGSCKIHRETFGPVKTCPSK